VEREYVSVQRGVWGGLEGAEGGTWKGFLEARNTVLWGAGGRNRGGREGDRAIMVGGGGERNEWLCSIHEREGGKSRESGGDGEDIINLKSTVWGEL